MAKKNPKRSKKRIYNPRVMDTRQRLSRFLIVCEGAQTEPNYFKSFRVPKNVLAVNIIGAGDNTIRLVQIAIEESQDENYDQVWCVFDRDSFPANDFNNALSLARQKNIKVAYSNEAFELWYLLHFNFHQAGIPRNDYFKLLEKYLGEAYKKNSENIYEKLESRQPDAIRNAKNLLAQYEPCRPEKDNPSTTVHLLVEELLKFVR